MQKWLKLALEYLFVGTIVISAINYAMSFTYNIPFENTPLDIISATIAAAVILEFLKWVNKKLDPYFPWEENIVKRALIQFIVDFVISVVLIIIVSFIINFMVTDNEDFTQWNWPVIRRELLWYNIVAVTAILIYVLIGMVKYFVSQWRASIVKIERYEKENAEFQFEALRNQVNPHFLFNSLNTLSSLIYQDQEGAATFVRQLSKVYRYVLENKDRDVIDVAHELKTLTSYIFLIENRFKDQLRFSIDIDEKYHSMFIPPMTLQMIIENAIKHNSTSKEKPLLISLFVEDEYLVVSNPLQPKSSIEFSSKIGLQNIQNRYSFLTDRKMLIKKEDNKFVVKLPLLSNIETIMQKLR